MVDNNNLCSPREPKIDFGILGDIHRGEHSFHTWLYDPTGSHTHNFSQIYLSGRAHLALHRRNIDSFTQNVIIAKTSGDKSGMFHIGPQQELFAGKPDWICVLIIILLLSIKVARIHLILCIYPNDKSLLSLLVRWTKLIGNCN